MPAFEFGQTYALTGRSLVVFGLATENIATRRLRQSLGALLEVAEAPRAGLIHSMRATAMASRTLAGAAPVNTSMPRASQGRLSAVGASTTVFCVRNEEGLAKLS